MKSPGIWYRETFILTKIDPQDFQSAEIKAKAPVYIVPHFLSLRE